MSGIGAVMFGKALVLAVWVVLVECWQAYRKRRIDEGLPLKKNRKGVYVVSDWTAKVDAFAVATRKTVLAIGGLYWALIAFIYVFWGKEGLRTFFASIFGG